MLVAFVSKAARLVAVAGAFALATAVAGANGPAARSEFDRVFAATGEPAFLHATILFAGSGGVHRMELWRDGERRVRRDTDGRITTVATRGTGAGYELLVLDHARRLSTRVSRDNLYRIGNFTDWFDLGHGVRHPRGRYLLAPTKTVVPGTLPATPALCRWYDLTQGDRVIHLCWDERDRFPLLITEPAWRPVWRVVAIDRRPIADARFAPDDRGYVRNDADRDVEGD